MYLNEYLRSKNNQKVKDYAKFIVKDCSNYGLTIADMKDLAEILPSEIGKAVATLEEKIKFSSLY